MQPQACRAAEKPLRQHLRQLYHKTGCDWAVLHGAAMGLIHGIKLYNSTRNNGVYCPMIMIQSKETSHVN